MSMHLTQHHLSKALLRGRGNINMLIALHALHSCGHMANNDNLGIALYVFVTSSIFSEYT